MISKQLLRFFVYYTKGRFYKEVMSANVHEDTHKHLVKHTGAISFVIANTYFFSKQQLPKLLPYILRIFGMLSSSC